VTREKKIPTIVTRMFSSHAGLGYEDDVEVSWSDDLGAVTVS
jgi:hypothetical protein